MWLETFTAIIQIHFFLHLTLSSIQTVILYQTHYCCLGVNTVEMTSNGHVRHLLKTMSCCHLVEKVAQYSSKSYDEGK